MDGRGRRRIKERFDLAVGFFGFFAVAFFIPTLVTEIQGGDAVGWALTTLIFVGFTASLRSGQKKALRKFDAAQAELVRD